MNESLKGSDSETIKNRKEGLLLTETSGFLEEPSQDTKHGSITEKPGLIKELSKAEAEVKSPRRSPGKNFVD
jgi:hypothetical protein